MTPTPLLTHQSLVRASTTWHLRPGTLTAKAGDTTTTYTHTPQGRVRHTHIDVRRVSVSVLPTSQGLRVLTTLTGPPIGAASGLPDSRYVNPQRWPEAHPDDPAHERVLAEWRAHHPSYAEFPAMAGAPAHTRAS